MAIANLIDWADVTSREETPAIDRSHIKKIDEIYKTIRQNVIFRFVCEDSSKEGMYARGRLRSRYIDKITDEATLSIDDLEKASQIAEVLLKESEKTHSALQTILLSSIQIVQHIGSLMKICDRTPEVECTYNWNSSIHQETMRFLITLLRMADSYKRISKTGHDRGSSDGVQ